MYLSLLANAVDEKSEDEIKAVLGHKDLESLNSANAKLLTGMSSRTSNIEVAIANSVWYNQELTLSDVFSNIASDHYRAELRPCELPDYNGRTVSFVNAWASEKTRGLIPEIYRTLPMCESLIINALYFKGVWAQVFEKSSTAEGVFHGSKGDSKVMMMHLTETMQGIYGDGYTAVRKMFSGLQYEAIFILPDEGTEIDELINSGKLSGLAEKYTPPFEVDFKMPRFKIASDGMYDFTNVLVDMGIKTLGDFQELPMFNPIRQGRHLIGQKAIVEFDEEGAKAAAVTAGSDGAFFPEKLSVTLDRPFVFFINERTTGVCLFAGKVMNPNS